MKKTVKFALAVVALTLCAVTVSACTNKPDARRILVAEGYTDIEMTGYAWLKCSDDDTVKTKFRAKKNGRTVTGAVCSGLWFKGATIRLD